MATSETLRSVIDAGKSSKRLDELSTARVVGKIAEQLHAAQQKAGSGKSVGPITPAAIAIDAAGAVKIDLTQRGSTLGYSAPEIVEGSSGDRRSDVFSLGVVMWEALTHQRLFDAMNDVAVKLAVKEREIKPPMELNANIPAELSAMCMKALARDPAERYQSAKVMSVEIEEFLSEAGYEDSAAQLVGFLADMKKAPKPTLLPPSILKPLPSEPAPAPATPPAAEKKPSDATKPLPSGLALASALAKAETKPVEAVAPAPVEPAPVPAPPKLPEAAAPKHELPKPRSAPVIVPKPEADATPSALASSLPPIDSVGSFAPAVEPPRTPPKATISAVVPPPPSAPTVPDLPKPAVPVEAPPVAAAPEKVTSTGSQPTKLPQAADTVALPKRAHRDSENVLASWAWQTDTHEAIEDEHEDFHPPPSKKPLYYVIGGGVALATIVTIITIGFGGSKSDKKPAQPNAQTQEATTAPAPAPTPTPAPAPAAEPPKPEVATAPAPAPEPAPPPAPEPPKQEAAPTPPPPAPEPPKQEPPPPPPKAEPPKVAKAEPPKPAPPKVEKRTPAPKAEPKPKTVAKAEPKTEAKKDASSVEAAYRMGLQLFARGDTQGALASLRTSLAGNPNYAPTWRGLGLVFEKMGEKDQARAAYKRYLQLSPTAGDAEQIRSRMERLGS